MSVKKKKKLVLALLLILILALIAAGVTIAYMLRSSGKINNIFEKAVVSCAVVEDFDSETGVKSSVKVRNTGNINGFIRVRLVSYWVDGEGNIVGKPSEMPSVSYDSEKWIKGANDTYYCKEPVMVGEETPEFLDANIQLKYPPDEEYYQVLEVIPEAIQSAPAKAVKEAWGMYVKDGKISNEP